MTEKLYDEDAYCQSFDATVTGCEKSHAGFLIALDKTAFYPEGGGQPSDKGTLSGFPVKEVGERMGEILHTLDTALPVGGQVHGEIDWETRFSLMQQHTGEHIVSGIVHRLYELDNVGFHMGRDAVTIDFNGALTPEDLRRVERLANEAVWKNLTLQTDTPAPERLCELEYRSKKALTGTVRLVTVPGYDVCACCGTHLRATGEIGLIKLLTHQRYKGGVRIWMLCGERALADVAEKNEAAYALSALLSVKTGDLKEAVQRLYAEHEAAKQRLSALEGETFRLRANTYPSGTPWVILFEEGASPAQLRRFCLTLSERCVRAAVFSRQGAAWHYALGSQQLDVRPLGKALNEKFCGRGGGAAELVQGTLTGEKKEIEAFLSQLTCYK